MDNRKTTHQESPINILDQFQLVKRPISSYKDMQNMLMDHLRLMHYPVAVKFIFREEELEQFKKNVPYHTPVRPLTFCQFQTGARMKGISILGTRASLGCTNGAFVFGWRPLDDKEVDSHLKYVKDRDQAKRFLASKSRLPEDELKAFVVSPLGDTYFDPDTIHFYCDNLQAYHLGVDYMAALDVHPIRSAMTMNSATCGGNVFAFQEKSANLITACSGSYNAGKTERGELNVIIPGEHIGPLVDRLMSRVEEYGSASITRVGDPFPGADVCKNCPLINFIQPKE